MQEQVILVDENDNEIGTEEKQKAHIEGKLHRAFSVFVFNPKGELLIQRRALDKYHSAGLWTNTCCSHPRQGEATIDAAHRRLKEELGFDCEIKEIHSFIYKKAFKNGLTEHEFDHVFVGFYDDRINDNNQNNDKKNNQDKDNHNDEKKNKNNIMFNKKEIEEYKFIALDELKKDIQRNPDKYTYWFKILIDKIDFSKYL
ncbi:isopentenyl-diphosphate Delta-isomerase [Candidatus Woesearchaeota archaeon]|nr:isopentenyl-diphosphate Delta-isomerase [Candidatus Woesearchaeota archaeon]